MKCIFAVVLSACLILPHGVWAAERSAERPFTRPKIGLVLSGGGARGAAHVGVLKVLEELHIPVDYIAGTSMGSAVGGLYATGIPAPEMDVIFRKFDWDAALNDNPPRREQSFRRKQDDQDFLSKVYMGVGKEGFKFPRGAVEGQNFITELRKLGRVTQDLKSFDELPIPFRCLATDLVKGESVVLGSGDLAMAIRASVSIAPMFSPVRIDGRLLVDGGYLNNIPVDVARKMGADRVIVVNIGTPLSKESALNSIPGVISQTGRLGGQQFDNNQLKDIGPRDLLVTPDLEGLSFVDFGKVPEMIDRGEAAARAMIPQLKQFSIPEAEYKAYRESRKASPSFPTVDQIDIQQESVLSNDVLAAFIRQEMGKPVDPVQMQTDLARVYGLGYFEYVDYHVEKRDNGNTLVINAPRRSWGPDYLFLGLNLQDQFNGEGRYQLAARYLRTEVNKLGGELQADGRVGQDPEASLQLYQPLHYSKTKLNYAAAYFVTPIIGYGRSLRFYVDDSGSRLAEYSLDSLFTGLDAGWQMSNWGELRGGLRHSESDVIIQTGAIPGRASGAHLDETYGLARLSFDTVDQVAFPHRGVIGYSEYRQSIPDWDSDFDYESIDFNGRIAHPLGEHHTVTASGMLGVNLDSHADFQRVYSLGGFGRMSSFGPDELLGHNRVLAQLQYRWWGGIWSRMKWYLGFLGETGGAGNRLTDAVSEDPQLCGSVFAALDTIMGPFTVAYSVGSEGRDTAWLTLGTPF